MIPVKPLADLPTHEVVNTPPHLGDQDLWGEDAPLQDWTASQGAGGLHDRLYQAAQLETHVGIPKGAKL